MAVPAATTIEIPADVARLADVRRFVRQWLAERRVPTGAIVVRDGKFTGTKGHGQFVKRGAADFARLS